MNRRAFYRIGRIAVPGVALVALIAVVAMAVHQKDSGAHQGGTLTITEQPRDNPLAGLAFYAEPERPVVAALRTAEQEGRAADAAALRRIADQPSAHWLTGSGSDVAVVRRLTSSAAAQRQAALLVLYALPHRDACGGYSNGGVASGELYLRYVLQIADALQGPAVFIVEPDGVADLAHGCLSKADADQRYVLLSQALQLLGRNRQVKALYLDAGNPDWFADPTVLVAPLHRAGVHIAGGLAVNTSNFVRTDLAASWSQRLVQALGDSGGPLGVVIDTSRNGNGPYQGPLAQPWCNPPGRALGLSPTTATKLPGIDAFVWAKPPGESDGECSRGNPPAGSFWPAYALGLARQ